MADKEDKEYSEKLCEHPKEIRAIRLVCFDCQLTSGEITLVAMLDKANTELKEMKDLLRKNNLI